MFVVTSMVILLAMLPPSIQQNIARIVTPPTGVNISVNQETFMNCTIIGDFINWRANNTPVNAYQHLGLHESLVSTLLDEAKSKRVGQLRIRGSSELNGTNITCIATTLLGSQVSNEESEPVLILVEGVPDKVNDLTVTFSHSSATSAYNISWSPPQTLHGVKVYYQVDVATCTHMHIADFEGTHLIHTLPHNNVSQAVNVIAVNLAGTGAATSYSSSLPNFVVQLVTATQGINATTVSGTTITITTASAETTPTCNCASSQEWLPYAIATPVFVVIIIILALVGLGSIISTIFYYWRYTKLKNTKSSSPNHNKQQ